jgi:hypothetical protein
MASPLLPYANSAIVIASTGAVSTVDGRITATAGNRYLIKAFLKRQQSTGTESGGTKTPLRAQSGTVLPGASGEYFLYRGYALQYATVPSNFVLGTTSEANLTYTDIQQQFVWMLPGQSGQLRFGDDRILNAQIQRSSGVFGGLGIDEIIYSEIGGVQIQVTGGELEN